MNKNQLRSILKNLTEHKAPAAQIDLWPAIQSRVQMSQPSPSRGTIMNTHSHSRRLQLKPAYILAAILLIGALSFLVPQGRALAQEILHFFNRGESNVMPGVTATPVKWVEQTPGAAAATLTPQPTQPESSGPALEEACGSYYDPHCSIDDVRGLVDFPIFALAELPDGMHFTGATGGPDQVHLFYTNANQTGNLVIWEEPLIGDGSRQAWEVGADAEIQHVQVGAVTAEYVKGSYDGSTNPPVWNPNLDVQVLRWVNQGILINLQMLGTEPRLGRDDLAALAASLTDGPVGESGSPAVAGTATPTAEPFDLSTYYSLTLAEAEEKAGFALLSPSRLPETLTFIGANYDEKTKVVNLFYHYNHPNMPEATDGLSLREQLAPEGIDCDLCGFVQGDGKQVDQYTPGKLVGKETKIETFQIGNVTAQHVEGVWKGTDCCGWIWESDPYMKRLRWQANGMAYELSYMGMDITKADLIAIAESLK